MNQGFIQLIAIFVLIVVIISLLGVSISSFINNKTLRENFSLIAQGVVWLWKNYVAPYSLRIWDLIK